MSVVATAETCTAQFVTAGGVRYAIWASTDATNDLACTIRIEPLGFDSGRGEGALSHVLESRSGELLESLTVRENEVARLVADGATNQQIAEDLCISLSTVKSHLQRIFEKLQVSNRSMLARKYYEGRGLREAC